MVAHIVLFEPKANISADERATFLSALSFAMTGIEDVRRAQVGTPFSFGVMPEINGSQKTYSYAALIEFDDRSALERYLRHPKHDELRKIFWAVCQATMIVDVEVAEVGSETANKLVN